FRSPLLSPLGGGPQRAPGRRAGGQPAAPQDLAPRRQQPRLPAQGPRHPAAHGQGAVAVAGDLKALPGPPLPGRGKGSRGLPLRAFPPPEPSPLAPLPPPPFPPHRERGKEESVFSCCSPSSPGEGGREGAGEEGRGGEGGRGPTPSPAGTPSTTPARRRRPPSQHAAPGP